MTWKIGFGLWNNGHVANMHMLTVALRRIRPDIECHSIGIIQEACDRGRSMGVWDTVTLVRDHYWLEDTRVWMEKHQFNVIIEDFCHMLLQTHVLPECVFVASTNMAHWHFNPDASLLEKVFGWSVWIISGAPLTHCFLGATPFPFLLPADEARTRWRDHKTLLTGPWIRPILHGRRWTPRDHGGDREQPLTIVMYIGGDRNEDSSLETMMRNAIPRWLPARPIVIRGFGHVQNAEPRNSFDEALLSCDLLVSTSGAALCGEIGYLGVPSVLTTTDQFTWLEQYLNADMLMRNVPWMVYASYDNLRDECPTALANGVRAVMEAAIVQSTRPRFVEEGVSEAALFVSALMGGTVLVEEGASGVGAAAVAGAAAGAVAVAGAAAVAVAAAGAAVGSGVGAAEERCDNLAVRATSDAK
jgi:hypothetical protein